MSVRTATKIIALIFFSSVFFDEIMGVNGVWILQMGGLYMWYMICFTLPIQGKNNKHCLETSVNSL
jgi:hypothetical protein